MTRLFVAVFALSLASAAQAPESGPPIYFDASKQIDQRVDDLISRMTLEEKAAELNHLSSANERLHIPAWGGWNQTLHGVWSKQTTTLFPTAIGMAATWDPAFIQTVADAMSDEARALYNIHADGPRSKHGLVYRAPVINISRDPRWGRIQECFGEDPFLTSRMTVAYVKGLQGDGQKYLKLAATLKHFAVNNVETNRHGLSAQVPERMLMEYWLPHWKAGIVEGHAQSVMASYNAINGAPDAINKYLLTDILRDLWHFDGFVVSDLGGINWLLRNDGPNVTKNPEEAVSLAIKAGCDLDDADYEKAIPGAVKNGLLSEENVNRAVRRVLTVAFRLGVFDPPADVPYTNIPASVIHSDAHKELSRRAALESIVLLQNHDNLLPLDKRKIRSIAVIGPEGETFETGNYYSVNTTKVGPLQGLRNELGAGVTVRYEQGCDVVAPCAAEPISKAADLARRSDIALVFLGTNLKVEAEGRDRTSLDLPGDQEKLLEAVYAANPKTVLILMSGGPLAVNWAKEHIPAILQAWYPGEEGGNALASVIFGDYNPAGRLPYTVYASLDQVPPQNEYDVTKGFTYLYFSGTPVFPFGYGLSYTHFDYGDLQVSAKQMGATDSANVKLTVRNTGARAGDEVVQLYVHERQPVVKRPIKELVGFERVSLNAGERKQVSFTVPASKLAYYDVASHSFVTHLGSFDLMVGSSSADIRKTSVIEVRAQ
jgi:beta-glucosidase